MSISTASAGGGPVSVSAPPIGSSLPSAQTSAVSQSPMQQQPPPSQSYSAALTAHTRTGELLAAAMEKVNSELVVLTYGAIVASLCREFNNDMPKVNAQLDRMGFNIGVRLIDEFLAKSNMTACNNFRDTAAVIARVGLKMFLGCVGDIVRFRDDGRECSMILRQNPLIDMIELPTEMSQLNYHSIICGCIRGALEAVNLHSEVVVMRDELRGASETEIRITLKQIIQETYNDDEQ